MIVAFLNLLTGTVTERSSSSDVSMSLCVRRVRGSSLPDHSAVLEQVPRDAASTQWSTRRSVVLDRCPSWQCVLISGLR